MTPSTLNGLKVSLNAALSLVKTLKENYDDDFLMTERLDQNILEVH